MKATLPTIFSVSMDSIPVVTLAMCRPWKALMGQGLESQEVFDFPSLGLIAMKAVECGFTVILSVVPGIIDNEFCY